MVNALRKIKQANGTENDLGEGATTCASQESPFSGEDIRAGTLKSTRGRACQHREDECSRGGTADAQTLSQDAWGDPGTEENHPSG